MTKEDVISAGVAAIQSAEVQTVSEQLGVAFEAGKGSGGGFSQADIDAAVAAAQSLDAKALADEQSQAASNLATVQSALDAMTAKDKVDVGAVQALQQSVAAVQTSLDAIKALIFPAPPAPAPDPAQGA